jgi:N-methylhydantoinase A/oxoprolinase/acetone carboxylase beta subunit
VPDSGTTLRDLRIGIDVGGTHTDAVVLDSTDRVITWTKKRTTPDVSEGVEAALDAILEQLGGQARRVGRVMLGTTHGINAVLERKNLARVAVLRLGSPATESVPPLISWAPDLRAAVLADVAVLPGGSYVDGREIQPLAAGQVRDFLQRSADRTDAVAVTGVFSPAYRDQELAVAELVREVLPPGTGISLSHEIGSLGLLARENATILNAALSRVASEVTSSLRAILDQRGISAPIFFAQNDGTLMGMDLASRYPVLTIGSGPANSIRGAAFLTRLGDALVADVGGTSTDFGVLAGGFPREATMGAELAGVKTNLRMPDVISLGIGGGTVVARDDQDVVVGPASLGYRLTSGAYCFGGNTPTLTDAAVLAGRADVGTHRPPQDSASLLSRALEIADARIADAIESMNLGREVSSLVVVGGGAFLIADKQHAVPNVVRPEHSTVANAVGVAIAPVSGRWDTVVPANRDRRRALDDACEIATSRAIQAGADPSRVEIVEVMETPVGYLPQPAIRLQVRAAGPLGWIS